MPRLLFEKTGNAIWISHLDLMRLFQRAFKRAGLSLKHTQGFNPRPSVSIALPLSVGTESICELLDFDLDGQQIALSDIKDRLNKTLIDGVHVLDVYDNGRKVRDLAFLQCALDLEYDDGIPEGAPDQLRTLFSRQTLLVQKKTKNGMQDQDIIPMIRSLTVTPEGDHMICINAVICCQNPTLNPSQLASAISTYLPDIVPDFCKCRRIEIYDKEENIFR